MISRSSSSVRSFDAATNRSSVDYAGRPVEVEDGGRHQELPVSIVRSGLKRQDERFRQVELEHHGLLTAAHSCVHPPVEYPDAAAIVLGQISAAVFPESITHDLARVQSGVINLQRLTHTGKSFANA